MRQVIRRFLKHLQAGKNATEICAALQNCEMERFAGTLLETPLQ